MKKWLFRLKKIKDSLNILYNFETLIKINSLSLDYEKTLLSEKSLKLLKNEDEGNRIIISLTTYGKRIHDVHLTIESLFRQTLMPNKIILWLAEDEFKDKELPIFLKKLMEKGLEIGYCKDLKSYKKIVPTLKKYSNDLAITVDDDIIYSPDLIENLYNNHLKNKNAVICSRVHRYKIKNNQLLSYNNWEKECVNLRENIFLTSGGGTLFPPESFDNEFFNEEQFLKLCPYADDVWINGMLLKNNTKIIQVEDSRKWSENNIVIEKTQDIGLFNINCGQNQNDIQIKRVFDEYNLWEKIING